MQTRWLSIHLVSHATVFSSVLFGAWYANNAVTSLVAGIICSHILHEWGHFLGAICSRSHFTIKQKLSPLFFDFDYVKNNSRQYLWLSAGGPAGNLLLIAMTWVLLPLDTIAQQFFLATLVGKLVYVLTLEGPVPLGILAGGKPLDVLSKHFGQGKPLFQRCMMLGAFSGLLIFTLLAASAA